jgi:hypothetical protein
VLGNNRYSNCTFVAMAHFKMMVAKIVAKKDLSFDEQAVINGYLAYKGRDVGCSEDQVLEYVRDRGFPDGAGKHKILADVSIDPRDLDTVKLRLAIFGALYAGAELPITAESQDRWEVVNASAPNAQPGSWAGHAMAMGPKYGPAGSRSSPGTRRRPSPRIGSRPTSTSCTSLSTTFSSASLAST